MVIIKPELIKLLEELFSVGVNYKTDELLKIRGKLIDYLTIEEHLFDLFKNPDQHVLAHDAIKFIDANLTLHRTADPLKAHVFAKPVLDRLSNIEDGSHDITEWTYYDVVMLTGLCISTVDMDELNELYMIALRTMEHFDDPLLVAKLMNNFLTRLLYALSFEYDYYEEDEWEKEKTDLIEHFFASNVQEAIIFCEKYSFEEQFCITKILAGLFEGNRLLVNESFGKLKNIVSEQKCEVFANKISEYQRTDRYEEKEEEFKERHESYEEVG